MAAKIESKAPMILGLGAVLGGAFLLFRKKKPPLPEPPADGVVVGLWNPPKEATMWQLIVYDWDEVSSISNFGLAIEEPAVFTIPPEWAFPLRVDILIYTPPAVIYYRMHSTQNAFPEFHREVFIPDYGSYYYNVAKERFE